MARKPKGRIQLLNGCQCSQFAVFPKNWKTQLASIKKEWYISYRFYDPEFREDPKYKYGKLVQVKGMNEHKDLIERRQMTDALIADEIEHIVKKGYNPITGHYMHEDLVPEIPSEIPADTPLIKALEAALDKKVCEKETRACLKSVLKYTTIAARQIRYDRIPIKEFRRPHMLVIIEQLARTKGAKWTANNHNHYRAHLLMLFEVLVLWDVIDINPIERIPKRKTIKRKRKTLTLEQRKLIDGELRRDYFRFWLLIQIFFLSGCRRVELLRVQGRDVNLEQQKFRVVRRKGREYTEVEYTIPDQAVPLWKMALADCGPEDYVFSRGLKPGPKMILAERVTKLWNEWVKKRFGVEADFYSLKHLQTTEISARYGTQVAAAFNNESEAMIRKHYDVGLEEREHEEKKKVVKTLA